MILQETFQSLSHSFRRSFHCTTRSSQALYGWGQTKALPLTRDPTVFTQPTLLQEQTDYALPASANITHMAAGWGHSLLGTKEHVYGFGLNRSHQLGQPDKDHVILSLKNNRSLRGVVCGREHSHIVLTDNDKLNDIIYSMGNNMYGQLGIGQSKSTQPGHFVMCKQPTVIPTNSYDGRITDIVCGLDNTIFATDANKIYAMGWGADGQLGQGPGLSSDTNIPSCLPLNKSIQKLSSSTDFTLALDREGGLWVWGNSEYGQGMQGEKIDRILDPLPVTMMERKTIVDIAAGGPFSVILTDEGQVYTCGYGSIGLGKEVIETLSLQKVKGLDKIIRVFAATDYAAALSESGDLFTWGLNGQSGRLGLGHHQHEFIAKQVLFNNNKVIDVVLGTNHAMALCI
ncbi:regulator of chromosome condensation 1/beta-lactamase-inhibitor protein II [Halteromyces radiatus]|uniref:regulator of chromosome condensation 1/beta-lactamase-inhibitor protein II n=1 Tax=Halteromyces radiatus TaxID=101107 RepID=UPI00221FFEA9|nr:regulator of chromosome condensation 1/beta-lactamase-inhibitor protein II [Halteromyces radiatus]KAI8082752.1 regulator of chromosome condensation 1/beta-lactamase-inhibitor protein II [Halteromyces radiatus]